MRRADTGDLWWKNAVFYCADIETFYDWNGDGTGDIRGMTERLEYLYDLGVTCLWLMPFYPTARKDDGYDIIDFFGVDPRLGTLGDFVELVRTARATGIRVIVDFVMNHTSDGHPWFKSARRSKDDPYRDYYVWSATKPESSAKDVVFPDQENSLWERDPKTARRRTKYTTTRRIADLELECLPDDVDRLGRRRSGTQPTVHRDRHRACRPEERTAGRCPRLHRRPIRLRPTRRRPR